MDSGEGFCFLQVVLLATRTWEHAVDHAHLMSTTQHLGASVLPVQLPVKQQLAPLDSQNVVSVVCCEKIDL